MLNHEQQQALRVGRAMRYAEEVAREARERLQEDEVDPLLAAFALLQSALATTLQLERQYQVMVEALMLEFIADSAACEGQLRRR